MTDTIPATVKTPAHTPLPWNVVEYDAGDCDHYDRNGPCPGIFPDDKHDTCIIHWDGFKQQYWSSANGDQKQIEANAAFIVRACNSHYQLVSALREAIEELWDRDHSSMDRIQFERANASLFTALSQAGGE